MVFKEIVFGTDEYRLECDLRNEVLRKPLGLSFTAEELAREKDQLHFGLFEPGDGLAACVVAVELSPSEARIRQMAVSPERQGRGLGKRLMNDLEADLRSRGFTNLLLHARASAVGFYEKLGYSVIGDEFIDVTIAHVRMAKVVSLPQPATTR